MKTANAKPSPAPPTWDDIARRAYSLWQQLGCPNGRDLNIWLEAERELAAPAASRRRRPPSGRAASFDSFDQVADRLLERYERPDRRSATAL